MSHALASLFVLAQESGTGGSGKGDSGLVYIIILAVLGIVAVGAALLIGRARAGDQSTSPRDSHATTPVGPTGSSGRPLNVDPDPDDLAGGRARMTDPLKDA